MEISQSTGIRSSRRPTSTRWARGNSLHRLSCCSHVTPTRSQLLTGLDAMRNGAMNVSSGRSLMDASLKTMADVFKEVGYATGLFGKWHLGDNYPYRPEDRGLTRPSGSLPPMSTALPIFGTTITSMTFTFATACGNASTATAPMFSSTKPLIG